MMKHNFKKLFSVVICLILSLTTVFSAVGCGPTSEEFDKSKVNLRVQAYDGGYGSDWLEDCIDEFEAKYADTQFGNLKGVELHVTLDTTLGNSIKASYSVMNQDIYFCPGVPYLDIAEEYLMDLTDVLTVVPDENKGESGTNKSIIDNMNSEMANYLAIKGADGQNHYYGLPCQGSGFGFNYDTEMFFNYGLYFKDGYNTSALYSNQSNYITPINYDDPRVEANNGEYVKLENGKKVTVTGQTLSCGPDGIYGTDDDGEPEHYKDFLNLCRYMKEFKSINPCIWMTGAEAYVYDTANALALDYMGYEQARAIRDFEGEIEVVTGWNGDTPVIGTYNLSTGSDKAQIMKNPGYYYGSYLICQIIKNKYYSNKLTGNITHLDAQYELLLSSKRNTNNSSRVAFLLDGCYWEHEAKQNSLFDYALDAMGGDEAFNYENRKFKLLASPKVDGEPLGSATLGGSGTNMGIILKKVGDDPVKGQVARLFFQYVFSDRGNFLYTKNTSLIRDIDFSIDTEGLTNYGKCLYNTYFGVDQNGERINRVLTAVTKSEYANVKSSIIQSKWSVTYNGNDYSRNMISMFMNYPCTAKQYFEGLYAYMYKALGINK